MSGSDRPARDTDVPVRAVHEEAPIEPVTHVQEEPTTPLASPGAPPSAEGPLGGIIPEDRPELLVAAAFAGGAVAAILLRTLVRR